MNIKVEACWAGNSNFYFRLTTPDGRRYRITDDTWSRKTASEALSLISTETGVRRKNVRFVHA